MFLEEGGGVVARAGTHALSLLAVPLNAAVVEALAEGPRSLVELRRQAGSPPQTTMRGHLRSLAETGIVERRRDGGQSAVGYELTASGRGLLAVANLLAGWLATSPDGRTELGSAGAKSAIKALVEGWSASLVRALAARPLSLTELNRVITCLSYPSLERRLAAMRLLGLVEAARGKGRSTPYAVTGWLRSAIAPLAASARWEQRHQPKLAPAITNRDIEAAFLLALPPLRLPGNLSGSCRLAVQIHDGEVNRLVGVVTEVREGAVVSCVTRLEGSPDAWALGSAGAWLTAVVEGDFRELELGGEVRLATALVEAMHEVLLDVSSRAASPAGPSSPIAGRGR